MRALLPDVADFVESDGVRLGYETFGPASADRPTVVVAGCRVVGGGGSAVASKAPDPAKDKASPRKGTAGAHENIKPPSAAPPNCSPAVSAP